MTAPSPPWTVTDRVTAMILTYNEEQNMRRTLNALCWAHEILVVDSGSIDDTLSIVRSHPKTRIVTRNFDSFARQCNFGLTQVKTPWVLSIDADYELSEALVAEICGLTPTKEVVGYRASFVYRIFGRALSDTLYPPRTVLYRREGASYRDEGHGHRLTIEGAIEILQGPIYHDDRKPLARWLSSQQRYAKLEADYILSAPVEDLRWADRIRLMAWPAPILAFLYTLLWKRCICDGWAGWLYVLQRTLAETMIAIEIADRKLRRSG